MVQGYNTVQTLPRRKPGPTLRALSRRVNGSRLSPGKRSGGDFIQGGSAAPAGLQLAMTIGVSGTPDPNLLWSRSARTLPGPPESASSGVGSSLSPLTSWKAGVGHARLESHSGPRRQPSPGPSTASISQSCGIVVSAPGRRSGPPLGKPPMPVPRSCYSCFIWSRSGIGNSFNRNLAPAHGPECPRVYDAIAAFT
jgi:hypothetical protein